MVAEYDPAGRARGGPVAQGGRAGTGMRLRAVQIGLGFALDRVLGDPGRLHPVAGFGRVALVAERCLLDRSRTPTGQRATGLLLTGVLVGGTATATAVIGRLASRSVVGSSAWGSLIVWSCLGGSSLLSVGQRQGKLLERDDIAGSRALLPWLCGRDPRALGPEALVRAVVESVAENTTDAAIATLFWAAVAGAPGAAAHRAANTLDAMVGHRSDRYQYFGSPAARLDDVMGFIPARIAGALAVGWAGTVGGSPSEAVRVWRRDARAHPSPNGGVVEAVCAGALGVRLGGRTPYPYEVQQRAVLGDGREVRVGDIDRAVRLHSRVQLAATVLAVTALLASDVPGTRAFVRTVATRDG